MEGVKFNLKPNFPPLLATAAKEALMAGATQEEDDGYKAALDYCREVGAIPKGWVR